MIMRGLRAIKLVLVFLIGIFIGVGGRWAASSIESGEGTAPGSQITQEETTTLPKEPRPPTERNKPNTSQDLFGLVGKITVANKDELLQLLIDLEQRQELDPLVRDLIFLRWMEMDPSQGITEARKRGLERSALWAWERSIQKLP